MFQSPVTFNAHMNYVSLPDLITNAKRLNPTTLLAYFDDGGGSALDLNHPVRTLQRELPQTRIFVRVYDKDDHQFHTPRNGSRIMSPEAFLTKWGWLGKQGRTLQVMNEPPSYDDPDTLARWVEELIPLASRNGVSIAAPAFAVHHPQQSAGEWVPRWDNVLRLLSLHNQYLNVHEYGPEWIWDLRMGRFQYALARCKRLGITPPRIYVSEWGMDSLPGEPAAKGYKARGYSSAAYLERLKADYLKYYAPYVKSGILAGLAIFSYGNSGGWEDFDVSTDSDFLKGMPVTFQMPEAASQINFQTRVGTAPLPTLMVNGWSPARVEDIPSASLNVRQKPTTNSSIVGSIREGDAVDMLTGWKFIRLPNGVEGYVYLYGERVIIK
jgi:hypothetical protein